ncbi:MAG: sigma-70 family RNA polymerase sigma factor [Acidimicrobiales bacterium]
MEESAPVMTEPEVEALYASERVGLVRLAFLMTGSIETAEDVVQSAWADVLPRLADADRPGAYLRTAVVNEARSRLRRRRRAPRLPLPVSAHIDDSAVELWDALRRLPERRRVAVVLRYWGDLSTDEIAEAMGCRPGTVSSLVHRGIDSLRKELGDD